MGSLRLSAMMTGHMVLALMTVVLGVTSAQLTNDDTNYVDTGADPNQGYYTGQYNTGVYSPYPADTSAPAVQLSETDRTTELIDAAFTPVVMLAAFLSALLGGIMAPVVNEGFRAIASMELPRIRRKDDKYHYHDRGFVSSGFSTALNRIVE